MAWRLAVVRVNWRCALPRVRGRLACDVIRQVAMALTVRNLSPGAIAPTPLPGGPLALSEG